MGVRKVEDAEVEAKLTVDVELPGVSSTEGRAIGFCKTVVGFWRELHVEVAAGGKRGYALCGVSAGRSGTSWAFSWMW